MVYLAYLKYTQLIELFITIKRFIIKYFSNSQILIKILKPLI